MQSENGEVSAVNGFLPALGGNHRVSSTTTAFNQRYVKYLGAFCGKVDLSCQKGSSEALRTFSLNCIQLGAEITTQYGNSNCDFNKILNPVSNRKIKNATIDAAAYEFKGNVKKFKRYKYSALYAILEQLLSFTVYILLLFVLVIQFINYY